MSPFWQYAVKSLWYVTCIKMKWLQRNSKKIMQYLTLFGSIAFEFKVAKNSIGSNECSFSK